MTEVSTPAPVRIDFESGFFFGKSGKKYVFLDTLPIDYWISYQELIPEVSFGVDFKNLFLTCKQAYEALTTGNEILKGHKLAADLLYNQMSAIKTFASEKRHPAVLRMAALWIVTEDEDLTRYDSRIVDQKIEDWKNTGIAMEDFFLLCAQKIESFKQIYLDFHRTEKELENGIKQMSANP